MDENITFGRWLKDLRRARHMTQRQLAELIGYSAVAVLKIENGERRPSVYVAELMAGVFGIAPEYRAAFVQFARGEATAPDPALPWLQGGQAPGAVKTPNNLATPTSTFIGRETEMATLMVLLRSRRVRLITITGAPGIGKTRLAQEAAVAMLDDFEDGVFFVSLAAAPDPAAVLPTIANSLRLEGAEGEARRAGLLNYLQNRHLLLVLDNFEHVLDAATQIAELLSFCPQLKVIAASSASLRLQGEHELRLTPLKMPSLRALPSLEKLGQYEAVSLFVERVTAAKTGFTLTEQNARLVVEICARLDGVPLAIELAAARARFFSLEALVSRLNNRLQLLVNGAQDMPLRHQALYSAIAWSYELLNANAQKVFQRMAVFAGGASLEAAETVCDPDNIHGGATIEYLLDLVDKSLLSQRDEQTPEIRFYMLETIREFALAQLNASAEAAQIQQLHADYYLSLAAGAEAGLMDEGRAQLLKSLYYEADNFRAALSWYEQSGQLPAMAQMFGQLRLFWYLGGFSGEALECARRLLAHAAELPSDGVLARVYYTAALLAGMQDDMGQAARWFDQCIAIWSAMGDEHSAAQAFCERCMIAMALTEPDAAQLLAAGLALAEASGDQTLLAVQVAMQGRLDTERGDNAAARAALQQSLAVAVPPTFDLVRCWLLLAQSDLATQLGEDRLAEQIGEEAVQVAEQQGDHFGMGNALTRLGWLRAERGDYAAAAGYYRDAFYLWRELNMEPRMVRLLLDLADIALHEQQLEGAVYLLDAVTRLVRPLAPATADLARQVALKDALERQADAASLQIWRERAKGLSLENGVDLATEWIINAQRAPG